MRPHGHRFAANRRPGGSQRRPLVPMFMLRSGRQCLHDGLSGKADRAWEFCKWLACYPCNLNYTCHANVYYARAAPYAAQDRPHSLACPVAAAGGPFGVTTGGHPIPSNTPDHGAVQGARSLCHDRAMKQASMRDSAGGRHCTGTAAASAAAIRRLRLPVLLCLTLSRLVSPCLGLSRIISANWPKKPCCLSEIRRRHSRVFVVCSIAGGDGYGGQGGIARARAFGRAGLLMPRARTCGRAGLLMPRARTCGRAGLLMPRPRTCGRARVLMPRPRPSRRGRPTYSSRRRIPRCSWSP